MTVFDLGQGQAAEVDPEPQERLYVYAVKVGEKRGYVGIRRERRGEPTFVNVARGSRSRDDEPLSQATLAGIFEQIVQLGWPPAERDA
jgi:hypothetical protein